MRLSDCFMDLIAYVMYVLPQEPGRGIVYDRFRDDVDELILKGESRAKTGGIDSEEYDLARFGVFVWVDETVLKSSWDEKHLWRKDLLQRRYYSTTGGGALFFEKLNSFDSSRNEVRELYYLCLSLGFSGQYSTSGNGRLMLDSIRERTLKRLAGTSDSSATLATKYLFPEAYDDGGENPAASLAGRRGHRVLMGVGGVFPVGVLVLLYVLYRFILNNEMISTLVS